jgi:hypothetical protein
MSTQARTPVVIPFNPQIHKTQKKKFKPFKDLREWFSKKKIFGKKHSNNYGDRLVNRNTTVNEPTNQIIAYNQPIKKKNRLFNGLRRWISKKNIKKGHNNNRERLVVNNSKHYNQTQKKRNWFQKLFHRGKKTTEMNFGSPVKNPNFNPHIKTQSSNNNNNLAGISREYDSNHITDLNKMFNKLENDERPNKLIKMKQEMNSETGKPIYKFYFQKNDDPNDIYLIDYKYSGMKAENNQHQFTSSAPFQQPLQNNTLSKTWRKARANTPRRIKIVSAPNRSSKA